MYFKKTSLAIKLILPIYLVNANKFKVNQLIISFFTPPDGWP